MVSEEVSRFGDGEGGGGNWSSYLNKALDESSAFPGKEEELFHLTPCFPFT